MPGDEDGFAMAQRLKTEEATKQIPIFLLTSEDLTMESVDLAKKIGIGYMHKGIEAEEFLKKIKSSLGD